MTTADFFARLTGFADSGAYLSDDHRRLSYGGLMQEVERCVHDLTELGSQRVALIADNSVDWLIIDLATFKAGLTLVPIPLFFTEEQRNAVLADAAIDTLAYSQTNLQRITGQAIPHRASKITYTSGSTGAPKGVCLGTTQLLRTVDAIASVLPPNISAQHISVLPLAILLENIAGVWLALTLGASIHLPGLRSLGYQQNNTLDQATFFTAIQNAKADSLITTPALLTMLVQGASTGQFDSAQLRFIAVGGANVSAELLSAAAAAKLPVFEGYGLSECGSVVSLNTPDFSRPGSVGKPLPHQQVKICDGIIYTRGCYMLGYLNTASEITDNSWHATGDLGYFDQDGFLYVTGRASNLLITNYGRNVSPEWPETLAQSFTEWQQFMVCGDGRDYLIALITPRSGIQPDAIDRPLARLNKHLPDYAQIGGWISTREPFTETNNLLTNNKRLRRKAILKTYDRDIQQFYGG